MFQDTSELIQLYHAVDSIKNQFGEGVLSSAAAIQRKEPGSPAGGSSKKSVPQSVSAAIYKSAFSKDRYPGKNYDIDKAKNFARLAGATRPQIDPSPAD